jgi:hypothetical protein
MSRGYGDGNSADGLRLFLTIMKPHILKCKPKAEKPGEPGMNKCLRSRVRAFSGRTFPRTVEIVIFKNPNEIQTDLAK